MEIGGRQNDDTDPLQPQPQFDLPILDRRAANRLGCKNDHHANKNDRKSANWLFTMHVEKREDFAKMMKSKGIEASVVHLRIDMNSIFSPRQDDLKTLDKFNLSHISLPLHTFLSDADVEYIIECIQEGW